MNGSRMEHRFQNVFAALEDSSKFLRKNVFHFGKKIKKHCVSLRVPTNSLHIPIIQNAVTISVTTKQRVIRP